MKLRRGRRAGEKSFFAKRSHFKISDIQLTNCMKRRYEIYRRSGIGFVWVCLAKKSHWKAIDRWGRRNRLPLAYRPSGLYAQEDRPGGLSLLTGMPVATCAFTRDAPGEAEGV